MIYNSIVEVLIQYTWLGLAMTTNTKLFDKIDKSEAVASQGDAPIRQPGNSVRQGTPTDIRPAAGNLAVQQLARQRAGSEAPQPGIATQSESNRRVISTLRAPVLWGIDTFTQNTYLSVAFPGYSLTEVATYLYGSPDFATRLRATNGELPDRLPPGRTLRPTGDPLTNEAKRNLDAAIENGTILRTEGIPSKSRAPLFVYRFSAAGQTFELTESQFNALLQGLSIYLIRKATDLHRRAQSGRQVQQDHAKNTNFVIRTISDLFAGQNMPPEIIWDVPELGAQHIIDRLKEAKLNADLISRQTHALYLVAQSLDDSLRVWQQYIEGTITGAENAAEFTRDTALALAAAVSGAAVVPLVIGGGAVTFLSGTAAIAAGAGAGSLTRGTLEVIVPDIGRHRSAGERFLSGLEKGAIEGGIGAAGALLTPIASGAISKGLFGVGTRALTSFGQRAAVNFLTGVIIGVPSGMTEAAITNLPALIGGKISSSEYLSSVGWSAFLGGLMGGMFGLLDAALSRTKPSTALARPTPSELVSPASPRSIWEPAPPRVNTTTGEVIQLVRHSPTGEIFELRINPTTGNGSLTRLATGEVVNLLGGQALPKPAGLLPAGSTETPTTLVGRTSALPGVAESPVPIERPPAAEPLEGDIPMLEARRTPPAGVGGLEEEEIVWVNTTSRAKVYHRGGVRTKNGYWATRTQAEIAGYRPAKGSLEAARRGIAEHAMVAKAMKPYEGKLIAEGWRLEGVEKVVGKGRVDELWVNDAQKRVFVGDTYTGPYESLEHFLKGWNYRNEPMIMDYIRRGYQYDYRAAIKYPPMLH